MIVPNAVCIVCETVDPYAKEHGPEESINECPTRMILLQSTTGNYGSTIWDCMSNLTMNVYLCDDCAKKKKDLIQISGTQVIRTVQRYIAPFDPEKDVDAYRKLS